MSKSLKKLIDINRLREFKNKLVGTDSAYVQTGAVDQTIAGTKTFSKPIVGSVTGSSGSCTGNAATATNATYANWLRTSSHSDHLFHTEWDGVYFWTYVTAGDGGYRAVRVERSDSSGNADTATKLATARTIALSGAATGTATSFDGSGNITIPVTALDASAIRAHILSMVYPVGSVYISVNDVSPAAFLGGTWEKISQGRVLQGAANGQAAGTAVEAGLPNISVSWNGAHTHTRGSMNITGSIETHGADSCTAIGPEHGAFYGTSTNGAYHGSDCYSGAGSVNGIKFSADRTWTGSTSSDGAHSHDAYIAGITGNSTTVQPPALLVNIWKRTA